MKTFHFFWMILILFLSVPHAFSQNWIKQVYPAQNSMDASTTTTIKITFDRPIDRNSISDSTISITGSLTGLNSINTIDFDGSTNTLILDCVNAFFAGEEITVTLNENIMDVQGNKIPFPFAWKFYTKTKNGECSFQNKKSITVGNSMYSIAPGDLDNDGDIDLVLSSTTTNSIMVFVNTGDGTFDSIFHIPVSGKIGDVALGDFNKDGKLDIAVVITKHVSIYENSGNLEFTKVYSSSGFYEHVSDMEVCDFNSDGYLDIAILNYSPILLECKAHFLQNKKDGKFKFGGSFKTGLYPFKMIAEDFDNSGFFDIAITSPGVGVGGGGFGKINIHKNLNNFDFILLNKVDLGYPSFLAGGDFNNDTYADIIDSYGNVYLNDGAGKMKHDTTLITETSFDEDVVTFDINGDSKLDIAYADGKIFQNNGNAKFKLVQNLGKLGYKIFSADLNGDETLDLIGMDNESKQLQIVFNVCKEVNNDNESQIILEQNFPNPFKSVTTVKYSLSASDFIEISLYNINGQKIKTLFSGNREEGEHQLMLDLSTYPTGIYYYVLKASKFKSVKKLIHLR